MLTAYATAQYQQMQVQTTPGKLIVMLYDGALRFLHLGLEGLRRGDQTVQSLNLGKAQEVLCALMGALDMEAGEIAADLDMIYRYCLRQILVGHAEDRPGPIEEVITLLADLREAWDYAERSVRSGEAVGGPAVAAPVALGVR